MCLAREGDNARSNYYLEDNYLNTWRLKILLIVPGSIEMFNGISGQVIIE